METISIIALCILILFIIYYYKNTKYTKCRYINIIRDKCRKHNIAINYSNIFFVDDRDNFIIPKQIIVQPRLECGNGIFPIYKNNDKDDIVLVETGTEENPRIEYDFGKNHKLNKIVIHNRNSTKLNKNQHVDRRLNDIKIELLNDKREIVFEYHINDILDIYIINTY